MFHRTIGRTIVSSDNVQKVFTCSTGDVASGAAINGAVIDRLGLGGAAGSNVVSKFDTAEVAEPFIFAWSTFGTTAANQLVSVTVKIQHGDSSGGGDMADYAAAGGTMPPTARNYFTTAQTTDYKSWTTGVQKYTNNPGGYSISAAKRFIRTVGAVTKTFGATSTSATGGDQLNAIMGISFRGFTFEPPVLDTTSSSTST